MQAELDIARLSDSDIRSIAEIVFERHGNASTQSNVAYGYIQAVMRELGYSEEQFVAHRIDISRQVLKIRRENS